MEMSAISQLTDYGLENATGNVWLKQLDGREMEIVDSIWKRKYYFQNNQLVGRQPFGLG